VTPEDRLAQLCRLDADGQELEILPFYGHKPEPNNAIGAGCLSQWWPAPFTVDGVRYATAEHWMMAGKARLFDDEESLAAIMANPEPGAAKATGRQVRGFDDGRWHEVSYQVVLAGNQAKFGQHPELADYLRRTGRRILVEASPSDWIWGVGLARTEPDVYHPTRWRGRNLLGFVLMDVRDQL
jgi:ribA/ribD-fused uncharacterized protein